MADQKISELTELSGVPAVDDYFVILDSDANVTKKVTAGNTSGLWTDYTPDWTASATNPAIEDGTLSGRYMKIGRMVFTYIYLNYGSATTGGDGYGWLFSLPEAPVNGNYVIGQWYATDAGTASYHGFGSLASTSTVALSSNGADGWVRLDQPFTWGENDTLIAQFIYEVA